MEIEEFFELIESGENERVEFKEKLSKGVAEEICALANSFGGYLVFGVTDDKELKGLSKREVREYKERISSSLVSLTPPVRVKFHEFVHERKRFLIVEVPKSRHIVTLGGTAYVRIGTSKRPLSIQEILSLGAELLMFPFDKVPTEIPVSKVWRKALKKYESSLKSRNIKVRNVYDHLRKVGAITVKNGKKVLTLAGALVFLEEPQQYFPHTYLRVCVGDTYLRLSGPLWKLVEDAMATVFGGGKNLYRMVFKGVERVDVELLPPKVLREAIINALVHRNYSIHSETFIMISGGKLSVRNPGSFPPGVSLKNPLPVPRNPVLYELMFNLGYIEKQGRGVRMILETCKRNPNVEARYNLTENFTELVFSFKPSEIGEEERKILDLLVTPKSSNELSRMLGLSKPTVVAKLKKLEAYGLVRRFGRGPKTRYAVSKEG